MRCLLFLSLALVLLLAVSCTQPNGPVTDDVLQAEAERLELHLTNGSPQPIYWTIFEADFAARANWAPCVDPTRCTPLEPRQRRTLPYRDITGYSRGAENAIVYWWRLEPRSGGFVVDSIRALRVRL